MQLSLLQSRVITPVNQNWDNWFDNEPVSSGFMDDREQPKLQERQSLDKLKIGRSYLF